MKKRITTTAIYGGLFLAAFLVTLIGILPYGRIAETVVTRAIQQYNLPLTYASLEAGPFGAAMKGIRFDNIPINSVEADYSPLSALTRSAQVSIDARAFAGRIRFSGADIMGQGSLRAEEISKLVNDPDGRAVVGTVFISADITDGASGTINIDSDRLAVEGVQPAVTLEGLNITGDYTGSGIDNITITTDGTTKVDLKGRIVLNWNAIDRSAVGLAGTVSIGPLSQKIAISGPIGKPQVRIR